MPGRDWPWEISSRADLVLSDFWAACSLCLRGSLVAMGVRWVVSMMAEGAILVDILASGFWSLFR